VFEDAGIDVPTSWDDWRAAAKTLTADGRFGMGLPANRQLYTDQTVYSVMVNGGASEIYNEMAPCVSTTRKQLPHTTSTTR